MMISSTNLFKKIIGFIFVFSYILAIISFIIHVCYVHFGFVPKFEHPETYQSKYRICQHDCKILKNNNCSEWISFGFPICEFACDSYIDYDLLIYSTEYMSMFNCMEDAKSPEQIEACNISCTVQDEL